MGRRSCYLVVIKCDGSLRSTCHFSGDPAPWSPAPYYFGCFFDCSDHIMRKSILPGMSHAWGQELRLIHFGFTAISTELDSRNMPRKANHTNIWMELSNIGDIYCAEHVTCLHGSIIFPVWVLELFLALKWSMLFWKNKENTGTDDSHWDPRLYSCRGSEASKPATAHKGGSLFWFWIPTDLPNALMHAVQEQCHRSGGPETGALCGDRRSFIFLFIQRFKEKLHITAEHLLNWMRSLETSLSLSAEETPHAQPGRNVFLKSLFF